MHWGLFSFYDFLEKKINNVMLDFKKFLLLTNQIFFPVFLKRNPKYLEKILRLAADILVIVENINLINIFLKFVVQII
jgi:hypothetical protein